MDFVQQMAGHAVHILHHLFGVVEDRVVDPLHGVVKTNSALIVSQLIRIVDMTGTERHRDQKITVNNKFRSDIAKLILCVHQKFPIPEFN